MWSKQTRFGGGGRAWRGVRGLLFAAFKDHCTVMKRDGKYSEVLEILYNQPHL